MEEHWKQERKEMNRGMKNERTNIMMGEMKGPMIEHMETMDENMKKLIELNKQMLEELRKLNKSK